MNRFEFPPDDRPIDPSWWVPLEHLAAAIAVVPRYRFFDLDDFMLMAKLKRSGGRADLLMYKHHHTRRHLNLDGAGNAYRYVPPRSPQGSGRHLRHERLCDALDALALWELPWMKEGLEAERLGLPWEGRWRVRRMLERSGTTEREVGDRGHLHLV